MMKAEINSLDTEIESTQKKLDDVNKEITTLEKDYEIRNTDQFKEKIAEERLGMVKDKSNKENDDKSDNNNTDLESENKKEDPVLDESINQETNNDNNQ